MQIRDFIQQPLYIAIEIVDEMNELLKIRLQLISGIFHVHYAVHV